MTELSDAQCDRIIAELRDGDTWTIRHRHTVIVASNDWPPPAPGTHSSDQSRPGDCPCGHVDYALPGQSYRQHVKEYLTAAKWSANA